MVIRWGSDDEYVVPHTADWVPITAGQLINYDYGGGGGWGDPLDRDPEAVLDDVLDEYVSVEGAERDYGVVLTGSLDDLTLAVDHAATDSLAPPLAASLVRSTRAPPRPPPSRPSAPQNHRNHRAASPFWSGRRFALCRGEDGTGARGGPGRRQSASSSWAAAVHGLRQDEVVAR